MELIDLVPCVGAVAVQRNHEIWIANGQQLSLKYGYLFKKRHKCFESERSAVFTLHYAQLSSACV